MTDSALDRHEEMRKRTKSFALRVLRMTQALPGTPASRIIGGQVLRSAMSVASNYRAAGRARSKAEFVAKLGVVLEEADETMFWLEILAEGGLMKAEKLAELSRESEELVKIFSASRSTARGRK